MFKIVNEIKSKSGNLHFRRRRIFEFKDYSLCLHEFFREDLTPWEHDHPRDFFMIVLFGGYEEQNKYKNIKKLKLFSFRFVKAEYQHKVTELLNGRYSLTLSFGFPQRRKWGYKMPSGKFKEFNK